jgi:hypothetical protein
VRASVAFSERDHNNRETVVRRAIRTDDSGKRLTKGRAGQTLSSRIP